MKDNVILAAIILGAAVVVAAVILRSAQPQPAPAGQCNGSARFQVSVGTHHAFIIDTSTGRAWETYLVDNTGTIDDDFRKSKVDTGK